jgi:hypothetical protein
MRTLWITDTKQPLLTVVLEDAEPAIGKLTLYRAFEPASAFCDQTDARWSLGEIFVMVTRPPQATEVQDWAATVARLFLSRDGAKPPSIVGFDESWEPVGEACFAALVEEFSLQLRHTCLLVPWDPPPYRRMEGEPGVRGRCRAMFDVLEVRHAITCAIQPRRKVVLLDDELRPLDAWSDAFHNNPGLGGEELSPYMFCGLWVPEWSPKETASAVRAVLGPDDLVLVDGKLGNDGLAALRSAACCESAAEVVRPGLGVVLPTSSANTMPAFGGPPPGEVLPLPWPLKPVAIEECLGEMPAVLKRLCDSSDQRAKAAASRKAAVVAEDVARKAGEIGGLATASTAAVMAGTAVRESFREAIEEARRLQSVERARVARWTTHWVRIHQNEPVILADALEADDAVSSAVATAYLKPGLPGWGTADQPRDAVEGLAQACRSKQWSDGSTESDRRQTMKTWWSIASTTRCAWAAHRPGYEVPNAPLHTLYRASTRSAGDIDDMLRDLPTPGSGPAFLQRVRFDTGQPGRNEAVRRFAATLGLNPRQAVLVAFLLIDLARIAAHHQEDYYPNPSATPGHRNARAAHAACWNAVYPGAGKPDPFSVVIDHLRGGAWAAGTPSPLDMLRGWVLCHLFL